MIPTRPVPGRTADPRRRVRLTLESLDGRDVPALLGLGLPTLPVSVGLDVPLVSRLIDLDVGVIAGPLSVAVAATVQTPADPGGIEVALGQLVSLDVDLPPAAPDVVVTPPVGPPVIVTPPVVEPPATPEPPVVE